jgi:hypothetical protein
MEVFSMAQHGVKLLFHSSHSTLDGELQAWLGQVNGHVTIHHIMMDSNQYGHCLVIQYESAPGPLYRARVVYNRRHDGLEAEANSLLAQVNSARRPLVALGSNDFGHCLCMIDAAE